jgi:ferredoxin
MGDQWSVSDLKGWTQGLLADFRVVAPVAGPDGPVWGEIKSADEVVWDYGRSPISPREWLLPRSECLFRYDIGANPPEIVEPPSEAKPTVLLLLRPCDVAGLRALDAVMRWDYKDEPFESRRAATILVALGCNTPPSPESCFCEAAGVNPRWTDEADVMITRAADQGGARFTVAPLTEAGRGILKNASQSISEARPESTPIGTVKIDLDKARAWMREHFDDPSWKTVTEACLGCGTCAFVCPSCHCFDMVDEGDWRRGERVRFWDSCNFDHFTLHASGHNPRQRQWNRWRQRVYHKMIYYPDKFGRLLCTGCGRCVDACPAGMDLIEILQGFAAAPAAAAESKAGVTKEGVA